MAQSYKSLKEDFVSNLPGSGIGEINWVTAVAPAAVLLWSVLQSRHDFFSDYGLVAVLTDFLLNVTAILSAITIYSSSPVVLNLLLLSPAVCLYLLHPQSRTRQKRPAQPPPTNGQASAHKEQDGLGALSERPFVTHYRGSMMVVTCLAILAVDFKVFPRRFAKVETWGTSLMDMGVGSFVFSAGLVSARPVLKAQWADSQSSVGASLKAAFRHSLPLLALGLVRLYSVKGLDYAEHVSEYGVHWNFFFTLALLPPLVAFVQVLPTGIVSVDLIALLVSCTFQAVLDSTSVTAYILTAPRDNLLSQNREGLISIWGYLSIFLAGQAIGLDILPRTGSRMSKSIIGIRLNRPKTTRLFVWSVWYGTLLFLAVSYHALGLQVSRRLANLPYVLWVSAFNCTQLALFSAVESLAFPGLYSPSDKKSERQRRKHATSQVLAAFNRNGLAIFLLANLLTGLVNLTTDTLQAGQGKAMVILFAYASILSITAMTLHWKNIAIKM
ncbi:MAG: hypothetical protein LQ348_002274 [Seirophora lacunosa]|nr:MAG: hypothetical protein LQ344_007889 [Seirophora lacunosa]KAI4196637.1 MAG: hypothetical protein LQ348_002274 [Seirophora lacunosa]